VCKIKYTFYAEDGTKVSAVVVGEAFDSGDKATNKAMSIAFKYACYQVFCIPTEDMKDPDSESHEINTNAPKPKENKSTELDNKTDGFSKHDELVGIFHQEIARTGKSLKWFLTSSKVSDAKYIKTTELNGYIDGLKKLPSKEVTN
jgi:hypothetical protein